jgi:hypothetical protein
MPGPAGAFGARPGATVRSLSRVRCRPRQGHATGAGSGAPGEVTGPCPGARVVGRLTNGAPESTRGSQAALWPTWARTLLANQISGPASATLGGGDVPIYPLLLFSNSDSTTRPCQCRPSCPALRLLERPAIVVAGRAFDEATRSGEAKSEMPIDDLAHCRRDKAAGRAHLSDNIHP